MVAANPYTEAAEINAQRRRDNELLLTPEEIWNLVVRPDVFLWVPDKINGELVRCPTCGNPATPSAWSRARMVHSLHAHKLYLTMRYLCRHCPGALDCNLKPQEAKKRAGKKTFHADAPEVLANMPPHVQMAWDFVNTGRVMCDSSVTDLARALATKNSWYGIADAINETKTSYWVTRKITVYLQLCKSLELQPIAINPDLPKEYKLNAKWVREFFVSDAEKRAPENSAAMAMEQGDNVLLVDWTRDAAARCGKPYLLNVMDSGGHVLMSHLTQTCKPCEAEVPLSKLAQRGAFPTVVYVDDECCGAWPQILHKIWPGVEIRLDIFHAIRRITQTVKSTQHPWHGRFCKEISQAFFQQDPAEVERLRRAWHSGGHSNVLPSRVRNKYVPRTIAPAADIIASIESTLQHYASNEHPEMGCLFTNTTQAAWGKLKMHVERNCLSEPLNADRNKGQTMIIANEVFTVARCSRGSSPLEGFHAHQKQWLGTFSHHAVDAGEALLEEGAVRWNRKRRNEAATEQNRTPNVFASGVLQTADDLHVELTSARLYPSLSRPAVLAPHGEKEES
jgi:hypothetical protein